LKRRLAVLAVIVAALCFVVAGPVSATEGSCETSWGSLPKAAANTTISPLTNIRGGQNACYDRLVLDFAGKTDGYRVRYVDQVRKGGDGGYVVPVRGGAKLQITSAGPQYDDNGNSTYDPAISQSELVDVTGWQTFRQVTNASHIPGNTDIGLGVRALLPYRVFYLDGPGGGSRLVIDVAHRWS
jgi:hypothetical protein